MVLNSVPHRLAQAPPVPLLQSFDHFPLVLGPWQGRRGDIDASTVKVLGTKDYLNATFVGPGNKTVSLWIAYYGNLRKQAGIVHSPFYCMTGSGWTVKEEKEIEMLPGKPANYLLMEQGRDRQVVYYWFMQRGRWLSGMYSNQIYLGFDNLMSGRADGALIRLMTPVDPDVQSAKARLDDYAKLLVPLLSKFIPN